MIADAGGVAIRIEKEIRSAQFVVADLTDERPSCYVEGGYADPLGKSVIYVASQQSVAKPGTQTKIHFDIHNNINYFSNRKELGEKLAAAIAKNRKRRSQPR